MPKFLSRWLGGPRVRRNRSRSSIVTSIDSYEDRTLLSGVAIYPQQAPAPEAADVITPSQVPFDYHGPWCVEGQPSDADGSMPPPIYWHGDMDIVQDGKKLDITIYFEGEEYHASGKVKGDNARIKLMINVGGYDVVAMCPRMNVALIDEYNFHGVGRLKVTTPEGEKFKQEIEFHGYRGYCEQAE
ncbi:MAG: hypothetical protein KDA68_19745 [Planctomycetaceae bacterium]|nr:hypothetical protein [Planctomycetaceae bacterium]